MMSEIKVEAEALEGKDLSRRQLMAAGTAAAAAVALFASHTKARAEGDHEHMDHSKMDHSKMDHSQMMDHSKMDHGAMMEGGPKTSHMKLVESAVECVKRAEICSAHCTSMMMTGDTSLKDCYRAVSAMLPLCQALVVFAASDASRLKDLAKLCIDVCQDCANECQKHAKHHVACKECEAACAECIKDCKELTRA